MANIIVAGELYESITGQLFEIGRQLRQPNGYPYDPEKLKQHLQAGIEGRFCETPGQKEKTVEQAVLMLRPILWAVTSDGRSAEQLIAAIEARGRKVTDWAKGIIAKSQFVPTTGATYNFVGIRGDEFAEDRKRTTKNIFAFAAAPSRRYPKPNVEAALLLREKYSQEELGALHVAVFHEPIRDARDCPDVLALSRDGADDYLGAWHAGPGGQWPREDIFAFLAPQVSSS